jgi:hypothetical protein
MTEYVTRTMEVERSTPYKISETFLVNNVEFINHAQCNIEVSRLFTTKNLRFHMSGGYLTLQAVSYHKKDNFYVYLCNIRFSLYDIKILKQNKHCFNFIRPGARIEIETKKYEHLETIPEVYPLEKNRISFKETVEECGIYVDKFLDLQDILNTKIEKLLRINTNNNKIENNII